MADFSNFNEEYWSNKITGYEASDWSHRPSPFARLVAKHMPASARILELGTGAGQDGIWFAEQGNYVVMTDATDEAFGRIRERALSKEIHIEPPAVLDVVNDFAFSSGTFDVVYAQLVLHYFSNNTMQSIMGEIERVLTRNGIFACMVNTIEDPEYDPAQTDDEQGMQMGDVYKRYFSPKTFAPFVKDFEPILFDANGSTPKDDAKGNSGMVQFIGKKK